jgi:MYXO-CTERM domain-containing protein
MTSKHLGLALAAAIMASNGAVAVAQTAATDTTTTVPADDNDDEGKWGLLGLLGLAGLLGLKRRDRHVDTRTTGTHTRV